ncbi:mechanosensitive ion channel family protein [Pseudoroseomonas cervicalis]|uniref:mechanosensitive ion channel family protein n=1 Tax=Teichococcus cervicalis TaxID=204525 RepID=UPI0022F1773D|nr:mechanosensitive ion channel family protein [Pseudoroseomonas cervicalis]WBV43050.1 mechanosensitive ion channel family protein [Pseudoroseomonas cervicalis]
MLEQIDEIGQEVVASLSWAPDWAVSLLVLGVAALLALALHRAVYRVLTRLVEQRELFWRSLVQRTEGPVRMALVVFALSIGAGIAPLNGGQTTVLRHGLLICFIGLLGWVALTALHIWTTVYLRRFKLEAEDNLLARKHATQSRILQRVAATLIVVITAAVALMTFDGVRQYGVSLLASAGAAGIVVGLALQPLLKNLVAGIQLAITQPIRLEDAVIVEGEWGNVEEISSTYVVVRLWDWRRMVLPLSYFIENPFQNWTREGAALIGTVMLYVDYTAPIPEMRRKLEEIAKGSSRWDGKVVNMQVTDFKQETMEVRMLVSAGNAGRAFDLRCEVREKMIGWLQAEYPHALPRRRAEIDRAPQAALAAE